MSPQTEPRQIPRPHDVRLGQDAATAAPGLDPAWRDLVIGAAGSSPYLAGLVQKEGLWLEEAAADPDTAMAALIQLARDGAVSLRQSKRRAALLTALADLGGLWPLEKVTQALTNFADTACHRALTDALRLVIGRKKLPVMTLDDAEDGAGLFVLAMGKMGAGELNYSSDIDLICLFDETRFDPADYAEARMAYVRAVRAMCARLSDLTDEGYVFRTDLRLRPDPAVTPIVISTEAAERYYESVGRTWERAAFIKARACAGDLEAGARFLEGLRPFIWRKHLDFAAIEDAHNMRLAIRTHKVRPGAITLPGHNMKLGRGGIREIEFFTQTRQLIAGGRDDSLRARATVAALDRLATKGWVEEDLAQELTAHYRFHRTVEHRLQMVHDAQTHDLPQNDEGFDRLAAMMDRQTDDLKAEVFDRLTAVHNATEGFFVPGSPQTDDTTDLDPKIIDRWRTYPALRSTRGAEGFDRIKPLLVDQLGQAARPHDALMALDGFLARLPGGVQLFALFEANPHLVDLFVDIVTTSPMLADYLSRNPQVFDAVIGGEFFEPWPGQPRLTDLLAQMLAQEDDYERKLDATRRWQKEWHFRIGVHFLRGLVTAQEASRQYADLASAVLDALWPAVVDAFADRHGAPPGRGAVLVGMGSLGAGYMTATSDLDVIVVYDPSDVPESDGRRPLAARQYYARLTQAMITATNAQTAEGRLYEIDMRLRPSGNQGPVATSWAAFQSYQQNEAWLWEHLALTRARVVAGSAALGADVATFLADLLARPRARDAVLAEVVKMRQRIFAAKLAGPVWDPKIGPGRLQDLELLAQAGLLLSGQGEGTTHAGLRACADTGLATAEDVAHLTQTYDQGWRVQMARRFLTTETLDLDALGAAGRGILLREVGAKDLEDGAKNLDCAFSRSAAIIDAVLGQEDA